MIRIIRSWHPQELLLAGLYVSSGLSFLITPSDEYPSTDMLQKIFLVDIWYGGLALSGVAVIFGVVVPTLPGLYTQIVGHLIGSTVLLGLGLSVIVVAPHRWLTCMVYFLFGLGNLARAKQLWGLVKQSVKAAETGVAR